MLVEHMDKLNDVGLHLKTDQPSTDQPVVTKKRVMECLQQIGQPKLGGILSKRQGKIVTTLRCMHKCNHSFEHSAYFVYGNEFASTS